MRYEKNTPVALKGPRKTDKLAARALCLRLSRYLDGTREELSPIRVPSPEEQRRREGTRRRQFLKREVRCLANRGHGQVAEYCHQKLPHRWWATRNWKKLSAVLDAWLLGVLEKRRELILALEAQLDVLEAQLVLRVAGQQRPKGLGEITLGHWMRKCAIGSASIIANRSAVTPAVVRATRRSLDPMALRAEGAVGAGTACWAMGGCGRCWSKRCGVCCSGNRAGKPPPG